MSETKFYIGQPVRYTFHDADETLVVLWDGESRNWIEPAPGLPNVWYQWDGGTEPPCDPEQEVLILYVDGFLEKCDSGDVCTWANVEWYMIIKAPEVVG